MPLRALTTLLVCAVLPVTGCGSGSACGPRAGTVSRVIDGDTIELADGQRVRYLMIDTPESTGGATDCYGSEAKAYNAALVQDRQVNLRYDQECTDRYDRLLAYVQVDGADVNLRMVQQGYACVLIIPPNGEARRKEYEAAEFEARSLGRGMWGACEVVTCD
jgi:micrococcal nuclease